MNQLAGTELPATGYSHSSVGGADDHLGFVPEIGGDHRSSRRGVRVCMCRPTPGVSVCQRVLAQSSAYT